MTVTIVRKCPINPAETLASRRRQPEEIRGDAITFPLREDTTNPEIVRALRTAQAAILREMPELQWNSKAERHAKKHFKIQKNLHLSFASTLPPSRVTDYLEARINAGGKQKEMKALLDKMVQTGFTARVKECKWNPDGHIVVRVTIDQADTLIDHKQKIAQTHGTFYGRSSLLSMEPIATNQAMPGTGGAC